MATGRLTFLYPHLLRAAAARGSVPSWSGAVEAAGGSAVRGLGTRPNSSFAKRHGKAVEPADWEKQQQPQEPSAKTPDAKPQDDQPKTEIGKLYFQHADQKGAQEVTKDAPETEAAVPTQQEEQAESPEPTSADPIASPPSQTQQVDSNDPDASASVKQAEGRRQAKDGPETVFYMGAPESVPQQQQQQAPQQQPPQQQPPAFLLPKYVHHFDSYSLVKELQEGSYSNDQAITMMKAIRGILAHNLDMAQARLVSKSDVENESYLFSAACSELSAEIKNNRRIQDEQMRQQRTHLQHEVDILTQTLNQELLTLTDNVRGLFNDRKMVVREEQKAVESAIQKINYKMSIMLSSDSKSEIEGVRWILIRRSVLGIIFMAILTLGTIRYATYVSHEHQREADRKKKEEEDLRRNGGKADRSSAPDAAAILAAS